MPNFPFFNMPYSPNFGHYYNRYNYFPNSMRNPKSTTSKTTGSTEPYVNINLQNTTSNNDESKRTHCNNKTFKDNSQALFSILGLDLYSDDILILCLLFFLYMEGIKDEMLFLCLILLLIS